MEPLELLIMETLDGRIIHPSENIQWNMDTQNHVITSNVSLGGGGGGGLSFGLNGK